MSFALYRRPSGVVFLDDDHDYLEMLAEIMPPAWHVRLLLRPVAFIDLLHAQTQSLESHAWAQQDMVNCWRSGALLIPQILQYWREDGMRRFALAQVGVVDYAMPAMSGLRVLGELSRWPGWRILLTGRVDEQLAIAAFNRGLINQYVSKQLPDIRLRLTDAIQTQRLRPDPRHQQIWRSTLLPWQDALLGDALIGEALEALAHRQGWIEHIVIGEPFGVLALNARGMASWLELEPAGDSSPLPGAPGVQDTQAGSPPGPGPQPTPSARDKGAADAGATWCETVLLAGQSCCLRGNLFALGASVSPGMAHSYEQFLWLDGKRQLS
ncbi:MAG: response regulator [Polaromonas sp.]